VDGRDKPGHDDEGGLRLRGEDPYGKDRRAFVALAMRRPARLLRVARQPLERVQEKWKPVFRPDAR
jgi:hypothetical protein